MVTTYAVWIHHEPHRGGVSFAGRLDLAAFIRLCAELGWPWLFGLISGVTERCEAEVFQVGSRQPRYSTALNVLAGSSDDTSSALSKLIVVRTRMESLPIIEWCRKELRGYTDDLYDDYPPYRLRLAAPIRSLDRLWR